MGIELDLGTVLALIGTALAAIIGAGWWGRKQGAAKQQHKEAVKQLEEEGAAIEAKDVKAAEDRKERRREATKKTDIPVTSQSDEDALEEARKVRGRQKP